MGYALEQYDGRAWLAYVLATIAFEAWAIGRWAGFGWPKAVGVSVLANFVTAGCCANLCGVGLHQPFVGSRLNPNPLANMALMFLVFSLLSGGIEAIVWRLFDRQKRDNPLVLRSLGIHLAWVPLGMAIMLVPARPYPKLEGYTRYARRFYLGDIGKKLNDRILETGRVPSYRDAFGFFAGNPPDGPLPEGAWAVPYRPDFGRLSTGQAKGAPMFEWNVRANGLRLDDLGESDRIWLLRTILADEGQYGLVLSPEGVRVARNRLVLSETTTIPARKAPPAGP